ncbi:MAG: hypothetical protein HY554_14215 [Elusimicrobia bacterium]|nr:hypothetical protein [Elusimicrobiota bacterium]
MAEAWARRLSGGRVEAASAGSRPAGCVDPAAAGAMAEKGLSLAGHRSKSLDDLPVRLWDAVVALGCGESAEHVPARARLEWRIDDPRGRGPDAFRRVRDELEGRVRDLLARWTQAGRSAGA